MKILTRAEKSKEFWFITIISLLFFLLRMPSFIEPYWYGDEGIYQVIGIALRNGKLLYRDIWDNKPPLLYITYSIFYSDQFIIRSVSALFGVAAIVGFFMLSKILFVKRLIRYISTGLFAFLFGIPLLEGNIANSENFMLAPIIFAGFFIFKASGLKAPGRIKKSFLYIIHNTYYMLLFSAGFLLSFAFLFKIVAIFDFAAFLLFLLFINPEKRFSKKPIIKFINMLIIIINTNFELLLGFFIPILVVVLFFIAKNSLFDFLTAAFMQNVSYVSYGNKLFFTQGLLFAKVFLLISFCIFLFFKKNNLTKSQLFIFIWFAFSLFNAFFSQRPYTHYLLVLLPSFCLMLGTFFDNRLKLRINNINLGNYFIIFYMVITIFIIKSFWIYNKNISYYKNFFLFLTNKISVTKYRSFFDSKTVRDYELASFLKNTLKRSDQVFIWGNNAQIYKLTNTIPLGRYTVAYHMLSSPQTIEETRKNLVKSSPKFIVVLSDVPPFPYSLFGYNQKIAFDSAILYERNF